MVSRVDGVSTATSHTYDGGRLATTVVKDAGGGTVSARTLAYDQGGSVLTETDAAGNVTSYGYDGGRVTVRVDGHGTSAASTTRFTYDAAGNRATHVDANSNTTSYTHDAAGRVLKEITGLGTVTYGYDHAGNMTMRVDERGRLIGYAHLGGRLTAATWYNAGATVVNQLTYTYDNAGESGGRARHQSGVGRGIISTAEADAVHARFIEVFAAEGVAFAACCTARTRRGRGACATS